MRPMHPRFETSHHSGAASGTADAAGVAGAAPPSSFPPASSQESNGTGLGTGTAVPGSQVGFADNASVNGSSMGFDGSTAGTVNGGGYDPQQQQQQPGQLLGFEDDGDGFDWLNNVDWSRGPWFDLGQDFSAARWS